MFWILLIFLHLVNSEWVVVSPVVNKRNTTSADVKSTTSSKLEIVTKTPFRPNHISTTPFYEDSNENTKFANANLYTNSTLDSQSFEDTVNDNLDSDEPSNRIFYNGFFPFLKLVQNNLLKLTNRESKTTILKNLRDTLLSNLHSQISTLWKNKTKREVRGYQDDHEMEFPSNEGALMTISFLTFAVYLIKLVIKLVQALKNKYSYFATTTTTTPATLIFINRNKREEDLNEKAGQILTSIESFPDFEDFRV